MHCEDTRKVLAKSFYPQFPRGLMKLSELSAVVIEMQVCVFASLWKGKMCEGGWGRSESVLQSSSMHPVSG